MFLISFSLLSYSFRKSRTCLFLIFSIGSLFTPFFGILGIPVGPYDFLGV